MNDTEIMTITLLGRLLNWSFKFFPTVMFLEIGARLHSDDDPVWRFVGIGFLWAAVYWYRAWSEPEEK